MFQSLRGSKWSFVLARKFSEPKQRGRWISSCPIVMNNISQVSKSKEPTQFESLSTNPCVHPFRVSSFPKNATRLSHPSSVVPLDRSLEFYSLFSSGRHFQLAMRVTGHSQQGQRGSGHKTEFSQGPRNGCSRSPKPWDSPAGWHLCEKGSARWRKIGVASRWEKGARFAACALSVFWLRWEVEKVEM